jgi:hypothetical protein
LQHRETEGVIRSEADAVGATILGVEIEQEPLSGPSFRIRVASGADALRQALERYAFKFAVS